MDKKYIITEQDLNGLMAIIGDSVPKTLNLDTIFAIHNRARQNIVEYIEQPESKPEPELIPNG